jgi:hypothetical protein
LLLHTEISDGTVIPVWDETRPSDVAVLKDVMTSRRKASDRVELHYIRVPITAERPPDFSDFSELIKIALSTNMADTPIVLNDQLGRGRSTITSVILVLMQQWLSGARMKPTAPALRRTASLVVIPSVDNTGMSEPPVRRQSYQIINSMPDFIHT